MRAGFNLEELQRSYKEGKLDRNAILELLITLIEDNSDEVERVRSLEANRELNIQSERLRKALKDLLISDSNVGVRKMSAELLMSVFFTYYSFFISF